MTITNPCSTTQLSVGTIPSTLEAAILDSDDLDLNDFPAADFPFSETFTLAIDGVDTAFVDRCGDLRVDVVRVDTGLPFTSVTLNQVTGQLTLSPVDGDPIGVVNLKLRVTLADYPTFPVVSESLFFVTILECESEVTPPNAALPNFEQFWGEANAYDLSALINLYTFEPECPNQPEFEAKIVSDDIEYDLNLLPGKEIRFNGATNVLTLAKCSSTFPTEAAADSLC